MEGMAVDMEMGMMAMEMGMEMETQKKRMNIEYQCKNHDRASAGATSRHGQGVKFQRST